MIHSVSRNGKSDSPARPADGEELRSDVDEAGRAMAADIFESALAATRGCDLVRSRSSFANGVWRYRAGGRTIEWDIPREGRLLVIGAGKAAASLAAGLEAVLGDRIDGGCIIVKHGHVEPLAHIVQHEGGHPVPDGAGLAGTRALLDMLVGLTPADRVFVVLTGGASALLVAPVEGVSLADKAGTTDLLLASGAAISEINTVRKPLSLVKGGRLLDAIGPAQSMTLMISDVPTDDPAMVGSGPTWHDNVSPAEALAIVEHYGVADKLPPAVLKRLSKVLPDRIPSHGDAQHLILGNGGDSIHAAAARAAWMGYAVHIIDQRMEGDTHAAAHRFAASARAAAKARQAGGPATVLLAGGETTLKVKGAGKGGRNQEFALVAALDLAGVEGVTLLAAGTDGTDGPTDAAGAFADGGSIARGARLGLDAAALLANNDSYNFFSALCDLLITGPTGTNVMDLTIAIVD